MLVDGQQRLTTLSILMASIDRFLTDYVDQLDADGKFDLDSLGRQLLSKDPVRL